MPPVMPLARLIKVLPFGLSMKGLLPLHDITGAGSTILADRVPFGIGSQPIARFTCHEPDKKIGQIFRRVPMDLQGTPGLGTCESLPGGDTGAHRCLRQTLVCVSSGPPDRF